MNTADALKFCEKWLGAWTGNRPSELIEFYSEDAYYQDPGRPEGLRGRENIQPYFGKLLRKFPDWTWKVKEIFPTEKGFTLKWEARVSEQANPFYGMDIVEIRDGKIYRNEVYFNPAALAG